MQIIPGYNGSLGQVQQVQRLRLYLLSRPQVQIWRRTRHGQPMTVDALDQWIVSTVQPDHVVAVDCAGWYFEQFNINTTCVESDELSQQYWPACRIEPDLLTHRPTYLPTDALTLFKYPGFLKYITQDQFVEFLHTWVKGPTILHFEPRFIQHNHLKHDLYRLISAVTTITIQQLDRTVWSMHP